jgi:hypothetical protein
MKKSIVYFILAMIIYTVMITYTLPQIKLESGGLEVFDMRPTGYTVEEGKLILDNITEKGLFIYRYIQLPLDFLYPMFLFLFTFNLWSVLLKGNRFYEFRWLTVFIMIFDYLENMGIYWILQQQSALAIRVTNWMSILKAMSTTVVMTLILLSVVYKVYQFFIKKEKKHVKV